MTVAPPVRRALLAAASALLAAMVIAGVAVAHSELVSSDPKSGAAVADGSHPIVLTFSEPLASGSHADITGPGGSKVGTATIDPSSNKRLRFTPEAPLAAGGYSIAWTSIATDGDVLRGKITFTVQAAPPSAPASASPTASSAPSVAPSASPSPSPDDAAATSTSTILPVIAAIAIIAILGLVLLRNRRPAARR